MSRLLHYTSEPFEFDAQRIYPQNQNQGGYLKPHGLWVSVEGEDDWPSWCTDEDWGLPHLSNVSEVLLHPESNVLRISSGDQLEAFHNEYALSPQYDFEISGPIDWERMVREWDGVIIAPYQWRHRMDRRCFWYYGWDCASGCIWNLDAVSAVLPANKAVSA